ncbi:RICIN domain-containing protein [Mucilaginibacter sp.]|jgi:hypothetical protein|uniref:RICIN domain-containing protein n=1 Tax=Mucilaginibacter sp. TaxID=1882438 RepID=UPI0035640C96
MMKRLFFLLMALCAIVFSCKKNVVSKADRLLADADVGRARAVNAVTVSTKAPLYWNPYEYNIVHDGYIPEAEWQANINWVDQNLKSYGYKMICIDGWGDDASYNVNGYRTKHASQWTHDYAYWSTYIQQHGMTLGMYNNPLWVNKAAADAGVKIKGTQIPLSSIINPAENATWFTWVQVNNPGAEQYVKGYIQYYADMGVKFLRVDFLSWYETGQDQNLGTVGPSRPKADYDKALSWMRQACDSNGIFLSLVMPNLKNEGELENKYGRMIRINDDTGFDAAWGRFNNLNRGTRTVDVWSQYDNAFDGYTYWSKLSGRGKLVLDGDFIRLNKFANDDERKTAVSLNLIAGGPVSVADQYNSIGGSLWIYQNTELLALNQDGFVGKPLNNDPTNALSQVWKGQMTNGDWVVGLFNREDVAQNRTINFSTDLGITGYAKVRDMWQHTDLGSMDSYTISVPAHGCVILKVIPEIISGGIYRITNRNSGKALDIYQQSIADGAIVHQWDYSGIPSQKWKLASTGSGYFTLSNTNSNKNMDVYQQSVADDVQIHQWTASGVNSQKWILVTVGGGYYKIVNLNSGKVLDVYGASTVNGGVVKQFTYTGGTNQQWLVTKL